MLIVSLLKIEARLDRWDHRPNGKTPNVDPNGKCRRNTLVLVMFLGDRILDADCNQQGIGPTSCIVHMYLILKLKLLPHLSVYASIKHHYSTANSSLIL